MFSDFSFFENFDSRPPPRPMTPPLRVRVQDHGYGYGYTISYPGTGTVMCAGTGTKSLQVNQNLFSNFKTFGFEQSTKYDQS